MPAVTLHPHIHWQTFLGEHELRVDRSEDEGFNHATYAVYQEFVALAERNLEGFLKATGTSAKEFQLMCQDVSVPAPVRAAVGRPFVQ